MEKSKRRLLKSMVWGLGLAASMQAMAGADLLPDIDYAGKYDLVCDPFGDFIGCSISGLNFIDGVANGTYNLLDPTTFETNGIYTGQFTIASNQGYLQDQLVIATGNTGQPSLNSDYETGGVDSIDDAYSPPGGSGSLTGFSTNNTPSAAELAAGVQPQVNDPGGTGEFSGDTVDTWDISIQSLLSYLMTPDGLTWDPYFVFANNQVGAGAGQNLSLWALVSVLDIDGAGADLNWEFTNGDFTAPGTDTTKNFGDDPIIPGEYVEVDGDACFNAALVQTTCGAPDEYLYFNNNIGNNVSEFIGFIPELTYNYLLALYAAGYDVLSVDARYFDNTDGFDDIFMVLGSPEPGRRLPEPGSLALFGLGLLITMRLARKRRHH